MTIEHRPREIQLTSKQLVFVFMSTVLAAVVVFLLGVWVGRGIGVDSLAAAGGTDVPVSPRAGSATASGTGGSQPASGDSAASPLTYPHVLQGTGNPSNAQPGVQSPPPPPAPLASPPPATITPAPASQLEKASAAPPPEKPQEKAQSPPSKPTPPSETESWVIQGHRRFSTPAR